MLIVLWFVVNVLTISSSLEGPNVCIREIIEFRTVQVSRIKNERHPTFKLKEYCCAGYVEENDACVPVCRSCIGGICIAPETCQCYTGFTGADCGTLACKIGTWGSTCQEKCKCQNDAHCDRQNGICICTDGFIGEQCERICPKFKYGQNCSQNCTCINGHCDNITGLCTCYAGWSGPNCENQCPNGTFGVGCIEKCNCLHGTCSNVDGTCICYNGWKGQMCSEIVCGPGLFGEDCKKTCNCSETTELCHPSTGECTCKVGWNGTHCSTPCPFPTYGSRCEEICQCSIDSTVQCDHVEGTCACKPGWKGDKCELQCQYGETGPSCGIHCDCKNGVCNIETGICNCQVGWQGKHCDLRCDEGFYGQDCKRICLLTNPSKLISNATTKLENQFAIQDIRENHAIDAHMEHME